MDIKKKCKCKQRLLLLLFSTSDHSGKVMTS
jgi:hypothetical protein